jgi:fucose permease
MRLIRTPLTWYCYLLSGFFTIILNIQGNIIPFLRDELSLSYRAVSLHPSAIAAGMIVAGGITERVVAALGRRRALQVAVGGSLLGLLLLGVAPSAVVSVGGCLLVGLTGAMIPGIIAGLLAQLHGPARDQAYAECGAVTYACVMASGLAVGATVALGLGWRAALLLGAGLGVVIVAVLGRGPIPDPPPRPPRAAAGLPAACVVYLVTLGLGVALEYAVLLWSTAFLEQVVGMTRPQAAASSSAFAAAMLLGRWAGSVIVRRIRPQALYPAALMLVVPGFALYWLVATPVPAVCGLFVLGLAVALLYPLSLGLAIGAAGPRGDTAGARSGFAAGTALLLSPLLLGGLADMFGLRAAHLAIPALAAAILTCFGIAWELQRRGAAPHPARA